MALCSSPHEARPPTGEADPGEPPVRFGGSCGAGPCAVSTPVVVDASDPLNEKLRRHHLFPGLERLQPGGISVLADDIVNGETFHYHKESIHQILWHIEG